MSASLGRKILAYLRLARPANIVTAIADILAGAAVASFMAAVEFAGLPGVIGLVGATIGLYGGGVVLNDVFDHAIDRVERPERPIPSGMASIRGAAILGVLLLALGIGSAWSVSPLSGGIALAIAVLAVTYDARFKRHVFLGPVTMGLCRAANLMLGISLFPAAVGHYWFLGLAPLLFIAAVTFVSRGEVHGAKRGNLCAGAGLFAGTVWLLLAYAMMNGFQIALALPFIALFAVMIFVPLARAIRNPEAGAVRISVKFGVLSLIAMDAAIAAGFAGISAGIAVLALLPVSVLLARIFAVT